MKKSGEISVFLDSARIVRKGKDVQPISVNLAAIDAQPGIDGDFTHLLHGRSRTGTLVDCIGFSHDGAVGKSGSFQKWTAVVLVLTKGSKTLAYRMDGLRASCHALLTDARGSYLMPLIEPAQLPAMQLRLTWTLCTMEGCHKTIDSRAVALDALGQARVTGEQMGRQ